MTANSLRVIEWLCKIIVIEVPPERLGKTEVCGVQENEAMMKSLNSFGLREKKFNQNDEIQKQKIDQ